MFERLLFMQEGCNAAEHITPAMSCWLHFDHLLMSVSLLSHVCLTTFLFCSSLLLSKLSILLHASRAFVVNDEHSEPPGLDVNGRHPSQNMAYPAT